MFNCLFVIISMCTAIKWQQTDVLIKWTDGIQLKYKDFARQQFNEADSNLLKDKLATISCYIKYEVKIESGKRIVSAYAVMNPQKSWIGVQDSDVLNHEQGHFDITEIYARRFQKEINDTTITGLHDYFVYLTTVYSQVQEEFIQEQAKYDGWTMNAPGKEYYFKWIREQLATSNKSH